MKPRLGILLTSEPHGGGAHQYSLSVIEALERLPKGEYDIVIVYANEHWEALLSAFSLKRRFQPTGMGSTLLIKLLRFGFLPVPLARYLALRWNPLVKALADERRDLWIYPTQDVWTYLGPFRALGTIHDLMHRYEPEFHEVSAYAKYYRRERHYKRLCTWSSGILVDSDVGKKQVVESYGVDESKVHVLPFIAPTYIRDVGPSAIVQDKYRLPERFLFYPAQFWSHKNHIRLIRAVAAARDQGDAISLVLVGSKKNNYRKVRKLTEHLRLQSQVFILDYVPNKDMPALYRLARALIMPTFFGPTNIPPLEAFATGCPVAVSDIYGMAEQTGGAALLFDPHSESQMTTVMRQLWSDDDLCRHLSERGLERARKWDLNAFSKRLKLIIDGVLQQ